jgi:cysteinyl-tRNA synthetase
MNITDADDKTIRDSKIEYPELEPMQALLKFTREYEEIFWHDLKKLNIEKPNQTPHATEFIPQMQNLVAKITEAGYAYKKDGSFYFDVKKYSQDFKYGQLADLDLNKLKTSERISADEYEKEDLQDFALWKAKKENEPSWDFEFKNKNYPGRPGWHIECSAMSHEYLKIPFDIHTGGVDLAFPHHENEIAQSSIGYGAKNLANSFLHNEHILVDNEKMSKSKNNFYTLEDVKKKNFNPLAFRYFCLNSHYRSKLNFTWQGLEASQNALNNLQNIIRSWSPDFSRDNHKPNHNLDQGINPTEVGTPKHVSKKIYSRQFTDAINDDLNTPQALAVVWKAAKDDSLPAEEKKNLLLNFDKIFGLGLSDLKPIEIPDKIKKLADQREQLRKEQKWQEADKIRKKIENSGFIIEDTDNESIIKIK